MSSPKPDNFKARPKFNDEPSKAVPPYEPIRFITSETSHSIFKNLEGDCSCHEVGWLSTLPALHLDLWYCKQCRERSGAPAVAWLAPRAALCWNDLDKIQWKCNRLDMAWRGCCDQCGSPIVIQYDYYPHKTHVTAVSVGHVPPRKDGQRAPWISERVRCHFWTIEKPTWYLIAEDGALRHDKSDPGFIEVQKKYLAERPKGEVERDRAEVRRTFDAKYGPINPDALVLKRPRRRWVYDKTHVRHASGVYTPT